MIDYGTFITRLGCFRLKKGRRNEFFTTDYRPKRIIWFLEKREDCFDGDTIMDYFGEYDTKSEALKACEY